MVVDSQKVSDDPETIDESEYVPPPSAIIIDENEYVPHFSIVWRASSEDGATSLSSKVNERIRKFFPHKRDSNSFPIFVERQIHK